MTKWEVIESKAWRRDDGATASPYGAVPWLSDAERERWQMVTRGWTVQDNSRGTVGNGRTPYATREEAQAFCDRWN
jgi:hypothetical protein